jgi:hypothetical protein
LQNTDQHQPAQLQQRHPPQPEPRSPCDNRPPALKQILTLSSLFRIHIYFAVTPPPGDKQKQSLDLPRPGMARRRFPLRPISQLSPVVRLLQQVAQRLGQCRHITRRHQNTVLPIPDDLADLPDTGSDDRFPRRHIFVQF